MRSDRRPELDGLRGAAVLLMVLDHVAAVVEVEAGPAWVSLFRDTVTRAALPLFMVLAGYLAGQRDRGWSVRRLGAISGAGFLASAVFLALGLPVPDVLLVMAPLLLMWPLIVRAPALAASVGLVQLVNWPVPWTGYQPGMILCLLVLGFFTSRSGFEMRGIRSKALESIGRHPLGWYLGHVLLLGVTAL